MAVSYSEIKQYLTANPNLTDKQLQNAIAASGADPNLVNRAISEINQAAPAPASTPIDKSKQIIDFYNQNDKDLVHSVMERDGFSYDDLLRLSRENGHALNADFWDNAYSVGANGQKFSWDQLKDWFDVPNGSDVGLLEAMRNLGVRPETMSNILGVTPEQFQASFEYLGQDQLSMEDQLNEFLASFKSQLPENVFDQSSGLFNTAANGLIAALNNPVLVNSKDVTPALLREQNLSPYMNPYIDEVISKTGQDMERNRQMTINDLGYKATQAGAFDGDRHGVAEALTNEGFARALGNQVAQLRSQGFNNAQSAAAGDVGQMNTALLANQQRDLEAQKANLLGQLQNQTLAANMATQGYNMGQGINNDIWQQGQFFDQAVNNFMQSNPWGDYTNFGQQGINNLHNIVSGNAGGTETNNTTMGTGDYGKLLNDVFGSSSGGSSVSINPTSSLGNLSGRDYSVGDWGSLI